MFLIKVVAGMTGLSVGTLIYYDNIGLLKVTVRSGNNYRLYTDSDLLKLRIIVFLKKLRFKLGQIKTLLCGNYSSSKDLLEYCNVQIKVLREEAAIFQENCEVLEIVIGECKKTEVVAWESLFEVVATQKTG